MLYRCKTISRWQNDIKLADTVIIELRHIFYGFHSYFVNVQILLGLLFLKLM